MYRSRKVKCSSCKDIFKAEYDSRKSSQDTYTCKCGKLTRCSLNYSGSLSYNSGGTYENISLEEQEITKMYYDEDYIVLSDEENLLVSEIIKAGEYINKNADGIHFYNFTNEDRISFVLKTDNYIEDSVENIEVKVSVDLMDEEGWNGRGFIYKPSREEQKNRVAESLTRFRYFITSVQNGELDLTNPRSIWSNKDLEWHDGARTQLELYDYKLYC